MNRTLSLKTLCVISLCLGTASAAFCWKWTARSAAIMKMQQREIEGLKAIRDDLEYNILNLGALVVNAAQGSYGADRPLPVTGSVTRDYDTMMANPRMQVIEKARADDFLYWYYGHIEVQHGDLATNDGSGGEEVLQGGEDWEVSPRQSSNLAALGPFPLHAPILVGLQDSNKDAAGATQSPSSLGHHRWKIAASDAARGCSSWSDCQSDCSGEKAGRIPPKWHAKMTGSRFDHGEF